MHLFFREKWEVEGLQTVGILLVVCSSLKLMHFLGLIDLTTAGKTNGKRAKQRSPKSEVQMLHMVRLLQPGCVCVCFYKVNRTQQSETASFPKQPSLSHLFMVLSPVCVRA